MSPRNWKKKTLSGLRNSLVKIKHFSSFTFPFYLVSHYRVLNSYWLTVYTCIQSFFHMYVEQK